MFLLYIIYYIAFYVYYNIFTFKLYLNLIATFNFCSIILLIYPMSKKYSVPILHWSACIQCQLLAYNYCAHPRCTSGCMLTFVGPLLVWIVIVSC